MLPLRKQEYKPADLPARWNIGIDRRRVGVFVGLALIAGFLFGFGTAKYLTGREARQLPPLSRAEAARKPSQEEPRPSGNYRVSRVLRGDTLEVETIGPVRLIGIESPDGKLPAEVYAAHGQNALAFAEKSLLAQDVKIEYDPANATRANKDESGRTLAYVYTADGALFNAEMVRQGHAFVRSGESFKLADQFRAFEREAMQSMRGVWGQAGALSASASPPPAQDEKARKLSPLQPSEVGPNIPALSGSTPAASVPSDQTVFVSGDRVYHRSGCPDLGKKRRAMSITESRAAGYTACSRCFASTVLKAP
ncbi:MAG TPA: thermonuclease family protein [Blastocatellia bacterium]|jgi:micrococcal nuclease|nr:thermonuclease family protein [Blastocatellia bacterium]